MRGFSDLALADDDSRAAGISKLIAPDLDNLFDGLILAIWICWGTVYAPSAANRGVLVRIDTIER